MKKLLISTQIIFLLSGCYTLNKAKQQVIKAHVRFPQVTAKYCSEFYPTKDSIVIRKELVKGETIFNIDSFYVDCDSIVNSNPNSPGNSKVSCPPCKSSHRVDTVYSSTNSFIENTAKYANLEFQIKEKDATIVKQSSDISFYKKFMWAFFGLIGLNALVFLIKFKKIML